MALKNKSLTSKLEHVTENGEKSLLDLPELALECILQKLSPKTLCRMTCVCIFLKQKCGGDHLWAKHMKQKWGRIIGEAANREWKLWHIASKTDLDNSKEKELVRLLSFGWPVSWGLRKNLLDGSDIMQITSSSRTLVDSIMALYIALENGKFCFPAQVYNRENANVGFLLSCYDAEVCYDPSTDNFKVRYPPLGWTEVSVENEVPWERVRAPLVKTGPYDLHISDCLNELHPGDHIEIQWRTSKQIPYGWWYGVIGHLESCNKNPSNCNCHNSDNVIVEFNQYSLASLWRRTTINKRKLEEQGNVLYGFYGGIIKLKTEKEISTWKMLRPPQTLD